MRGGRQRERRRECQRVEDAEGGARHPDSVGSCGRRGWEDVRGVREVKEPLGRRKRAEKNGPNKKLLKKNVRVFSYGQNDSWRGRLVAWPSRAPPCAPDRNIVRANTDQTEIEGFCVNYSTKGHTLVHFLA